MKKLLLFVLFGITVLNTVAQNCNQGDQNQMTPKGCVVSPNPDAEGKTFVYHPLDPNEIIGTKGYDALGDTLQWVAATASLPYTIYFENDPDLATAAAQKVEIRHTLHPKADTSTFAVGAFGFGSHVFTVEGNRSTYQQRLDLTADMGIYVDVVAGIDIVANEVFWIFQSIDPATGLPPQGTQQGFLPVNDENGSGEGYVSFTIKPKANACVTGDVVTASASIIFDINEAIPTNVWHNTVDALPPTTQLTGQEGNDNEVLLQFSGTDDQGGCGIKQYKLYVSDNYGAYSLYDTYPAGSEATFPTEYDHCYRFFCLGEDNVGNVEEMKEEAEYEYGNYNLTVSATAYPEEGGTVVGTGLFAYGSTATLTASANSGYEFSGWTNQGVTVSTEPSFSITVTENCNMIAQFIPSVASQLVSFSSGWNWWSTYIEQSNNDGLSELEDALGNKGLTIKSQNEFVDNYYQYMDENYWYGSLESISNEQSYVVNVTEDCNFTLSGAKAMPDNHPITLQPNWNWIGYPVAISNNVTTALANFAPSSDDVIKSQTDYAFYYEGYGWYPEDLMLVPGKGYKYNSNATENKTLVYANGSNRGTVALTAETHQWALDSHAYADNLNVTAVVFIEDEEQQNEHLELGAFVNGVCRGSARLRHFGPTDRYYAMLTVSGEDGERIEFGYIDNENGQCDMGAKESFTFVQDAVIGKLDKPFAVHFNIDVQIQTFTEQLTIYPNPVSMNQTFSLDIPQNEMVTEITVTDMLGAVVRHEEGAVNVNANEGLPSGGVYMIEAVAKSGNIYRGRLIVK